MNRERIPVEEYEKLTKQFTAEKYDPNLWTGLADWHVARWSGRELWLGGIKTRVSSACIVSTGQALTFNQTFESTERRHLFDLPEKATDLAIRVDPADAF